MSDKKRDLITKWVFIGIFTAITIASFVFHNRIFGATSVFYKNVTKNEFVNKMYQKIPAIISTVRIITITVLVYQLFKLLTMKTLAHTNRQITIIKLVNSFIKWGIVVFAILWTLSKWGVDTSTLIASAGILTLVIGLGAQSLISDIVAGVFIVLEAEYLVGDIVIIDGWRGTVKEIGIRTTKIEDAGGNIKIINNSEIKSIINQTQELSLARCVVSIEYGESLPRVELVIRDNLDKIKAAIPAIVDGPFYKGVTELGNSSVDLLFLAKCNEEDIYQVQRDMNREIKLLFDANDINIPFAQIVVNQPTEFKKKETKATKSSAEKFVSQQKEASKDVEEKVQ